MYFKCFPVSILFLLLCNIVVIFRRNVVAAKVTLISLSSNHAAQIYSLMPAFSAHKKLKTRNDEMTIALFFIPLRTI